MSDYKYDWKKGDKLEVIDAIGDLENGEIHIADETIATNNDDYRSPTISPNGTRCELYARRFRKTNKKGKPYKQKPIVKHIVIQDDCNNQIGIYDSYKEAVSQLPDSDKCHTVYELVPVAKVQNAPKVTRLKLVSPKKKK